MSPQPFSNRIRRWLPLLALLLGVGVMGAVRESRTGGDIAWASTYTTGQQQASQVAKPLLLSFHTPGCGWCAKMDAETFTDPQVVELSRRYICVRLDGEVDSNLAQRYGVFGYPTTIVTDAQGNTISRMEGYTPPDQFVTALRRIDEAFTTHNGAVRSKRP